MKTTFDRLVLRNDRWHCFQLAIMGLNTYFLTNNP